MSMFRRKSIQFDGGKVLLERRGLKPPEGGERRRGSLTCSQLLSLPSLTLSNSDGKHAQPKVSGHPSVLHERVSADQIDPRLLSELDAEHLGAPKAASSLPPSPRQEVAGNVIQLRRQKSSRRSYKSQDRNGRVDERSPTHQPAHSFRRNSLVAR